MGRQYLKDSILVCSKSSDKKYARRFTIRGRRNEGSTVVCYDAYDENSNVGILKEYYPLYEYSVTRNEDGQLVHAEDSFEEGIHRFEEGRTRYVEQHRMLLEKKRDSGNEMLAAFIPAFEIYSGCDEDLNEIGTTYIWTPQPKVLSFKEFCDQIHADPDEKPEYYLFAVLKGIESLTKCLGALHREGLIHRDIKPSNFGFQKLGEETLTQTLTMFDIDSICSVFDSVSYTMGTPAFMEPEALRQKPGIQTDIYAIGATLFQAICINDETKKNDCLYSPEYSDRLKELVDSSFLMRGSEVNSNPNLRNILAGILDKCLAPRNRRYKRTEDLLVDLEQALFYVVPAGIARKEQKGQKWVLADASKVLDQNKEKNSSLVIRHHLYEIPLYRYEEENEKELNVLVLGLGGYGQKFLDICLQTGQMLDRELNVITISANPDDLSLYLSPRKGLKDFFRINGTAPEGMEVFGNITSNTFRFDDSDEKNLKESVEEALKEFCFGKHIHYIFTALGDDKRSQNTAKICHQYYNSRFGVRTSVQFVREGRRISTELPQGLAAVYVDEDAKSYRNYKDIERMAFNAHCIWETETNYYARKQKFREPYNHDSSVDNVLSLKYKLHSIGIDLDKMDTKEAAETFLTRMVEKSSIAPGLINNLTWLEHRRWITERVCTGWTALTDLSWCLNGYEKDEDGKRNVCIVPSRNDQMLAEWNHEKWDTASEEELSKLDDLDRMSVLLHRTYAAKAKEMHRKNLLNSSLLNEIRTLVFTSPTALDAYREWFESIQDIWNREDHKVAVYQQRKTHLKNSLSELPKDTKEAVDTHIDLFDKEFYVMYKSMEYKNWKENDTGLIRNIPFILTHTDDSCIAVPFQMGDNDALFANAASALLLDPERIIYLCWLEKKDSVRNLLSGMEAIVKLFDRKGIRSSIIIYLLHRIEMSDLVNEDLNNKLKQLSSRIETPRTIKMEKTAETVKELEERLRKGPCRQEFFGLEKNESGLSYLLDGAGVYDRLPNYRCDAKNRTFEPLKGCEVLRYKTRDVCLTVNDISAFRLSASNSGKHPEFYGDYEELWSVYNASAPVWKALSMLLEEYSEEKDRLIILNLREDSKKKEPETLRYIVPSMCGRTVSEIVKGLIKEGACEADSGVYGYTSDAVEVIIRDRYGNKMYYDRLFANVYSLTDADAVKVFHMNATAVKVEFDNLTV